MRMRARIQSARHGQAKPSAMRLLALKILAVMAIAALVRAVPLLANQPSAVQPTPATAAAARKPLHPRQRAHAVPSAKPVALPVVPAVPVAPPEPELPRWPANDSPSPASVTWDSHGLRIDADNSSLAQILRDVATATGATVEGFATDQRVFGSFGPGQARDILAQLLQGSGYNILLVGEQGQGTPRQILLSLGNEAMHAASANPSGSPAPSDDDDADNDEPAPQPEPQRPPGLPARSSQQMQQEIQQRQRQMQQRGGMPNNAGNPVNPPN